MDVYTCVQGHSIHLLRQIDKHIYNLHDVLLYLNKVLHKPLHF